MADNIDVTPGAGKTIAGDDIGGALHQRVKVVLGVDGINDGDISAANPMPISAPPSLPLPAGAATEATLSGVKTKTDLLTYDGSNFLKVNIAAGGGGGGAMTVADGADVAEGATTDAAVSTDANGTVSAKLRGVIKLIISVISAGKVLVDGSGTTQPVSGPLTDGQLRATPVPVSGTVTATGGLTDTQLRASAVPVSNATLPLPSGASTEATLALIKAKTDGLNFTGADLKVVDSSVGGGGLTDTQLRATPVPVSGPLTDTQLRATAVPISAAALPLPAGASTEATLALIKAKTDNLDVALSTRTKPADTQPISAASLPLPTGASTTAKQPALGTAGTASADVISIQGIASMTAVKVDGSAVTQPVSGTVTITPPANASTNVAQLAGTATSVNSGNADAGTLRVITATDGPLNTNLGAITDAAIITDTTGSLSGKIRGLVKWAFERMPTSLGQKAMSASLPIVLASDQASIPVAATLQAGSALIGKAGIDQTTPGTTNKVSVGTLVNSQVNATQTAFTITLASLATSTAGVGRQSTLVTNSSGFKKVIVFLSIKLGTTPTGNKAVYVYGIRDNGNSIADDGAGASDAALTVLNAPLLGVLQDKASPATGDVLVGAFDFWNPGAKFGIAVVHDTAVNLDSTEGNHSKTYIGITEQLV